MDDPFYLDGVDGVNSDDFSFSPSTKEAHVVKKKEETDDKNPAFSAEPNDNEFEKKKGPDYNDCFRLVSHLKQDGHELVLDLLEHNGRACIGIWKKDDERVSQLWRHNPNTHSLESIAFRCCLDNVGVHGQRDIYGSPVILWANNERDWQQWYFVKNSSAKKEEGYYQILNKYSMRALDVLGFQGVRNIPGCTVALWSRSRAKWQLWKPESVIPPEKMTDKTPMIYQLASAVKNNNVQPLRTEVYDPKNPYARKR